MSKKKITTLDTIRTILLVKKYGIVKVAKLYNRSYNTIRKRIKKFEDEINIDIFYPNDYTAFTREGERYLKRFEENYRSVKRINVETRVIRESTYKSTLDFNKIIDKWINEGWSIALKCMSDEHESYAIFYRHFFDNSEFDVFIENELGSINEIGIVD